MKVSVTVHPNAKQPRVESDLLEQLHVYVHEPPLEGQANQATVKALAHHFQVKKNQVVLISGQTSKTKLFEIFKL